MAGLTESVTAPRWRVHGYVATAGKHSVTGKRGKEFGNWFFYILKSELWGQVLV